VFTEAHKIKRELKDRKIMEQLDRIITHGNCHTNHQRRSSLEKLVAAPTSLFCYADTRAMPIAG
jgi:DNA-binding LacI/PurR family transcriptional regulator